MCLVIPVGVTKDTVTSTLSIAKIEDRISCLVGVTVYGLEDAKRDILDGLKDASQAMGFKFYELWVNEYRPEEFAREFLRVLLDQDPSKVFLSLLSGSRFLTPLLFQVLLYYWSLTGRPLYILHGIEGGEWRIEPLPGFISIDLPRSQRKVFSQIYSSPREEIRTVEDLIKPHGYGRSIYKVLRELERKGLILWRKNRIIKTTPGKILYELIRVASREV